MNINLTLIGQTIMFAMFVWFCMKFVWPPLVEAMAARKKAIEDGLKAAELGKEEHALAQKNAEDLIETSKTQAAEIIANAGEEGAIIVQEVKAGKKDFGYNARSEKFENLFKAGVIDPTKVTRYALQNAASVTGLLLTTEAMVTDAPQDDAPVAPMPDMGGMGGMGGMM